MRYETLIIPYAQHWFDFVFGGFSEQIVETVLMRFLDAAPAPRTPVIEEVAGSDGGAAPAGDAGAPAEKQ